MNLEEITEYVKKNLSETRFYHSKCVMDMCEELSVIYGEDINKAKCVGIAHDIAKEMPSEEKLQYIKDNGMKIDDIEEKYPTLLHAKIGADIAIKKFGFSEDMKKAIEEHTTAKENMSLLSKILYIADWVGKDRNFDNTNYLRELAKKDLDKAIIYALDLTIKDKLEGNLEIHLDTIRARNFLLNEKDIS